MSEKQWPFKQSDAVKLIEQYTALLADAKELRDALVYIAKRVKPCRGTSCTCEMDTAHNALAKWDEKYGPKTCVMHDDPDGRSHSGGRNG